VTAREATAELVSICLGDSMTDETTLSPSSAAPGLLLDERVAARVATAGAIELRVFLAFLAGVVLRSSSSSSSRPRPRPRTELSRAV
jgi:hypothetical protein